MKTFIIILVTLLFVAILLMLGWKWFKGLFNPKYFKKK